MQTNIKHIGKMQGYRSKTSIIFPAWGLYHSNWVGFNYHKLRIPHKLPCLEGALIFILDLHSQKEARHMLARAGQMSGAH